jgi:Gnt-I system low-affinity gluconate transporter
MGVAHAFIPPTPGPVAVAALLNADLGWVIFFGIVAGVPATAVGGILYGKYIANKMYIEIPEQMARDMPSGDTESKDLPSFANVMTIIGLPIVLILANTVTAVVLPKESLLVQWIGFIGHPFIALLLSALLAFYTLGTLRGYTRDEIQRIATRSMEPVGLIILVTGAGGVFGKVLIATGVGAALADTMAATGLPMVLLAFLIALVVRLSQGSATVAMVTAAGLIAPAIEAGSFSAPLVGCITIAIAAGATMASHVNDSGFWLVCRYMGMTEKQTIQSWTAVSSIVGAVGMLVVLVISFFV